MGTTVTEEIRLNEKPHRAGRTMDALIAEKVMGWVLNRNHITKDLAPLELTSPEWMEAQDWRERVTRSDVGDEAVRLDAYMPSFSTEVVAAFEVVERMRDLGHHFSLHSHTKLRDNKRWAAHFWPFGTDRNGTTLGGTLPLSICLAALAEFEVRG